ncbi:hypothetical protein D3C81_1885290 [compost metagenome]
MLGGILQELEAVPCGGILQQTQIIRVVLLVEGKRFALQLILVQLQITPLGTAVVHGLGGIPEQALFPCKADMTVIMRPG